MGLLGQLVAGFRSYLVAWRWLSTVGGREEARQRESMTTRTQENGTARRADTADAPQSNLQSSKSFGSKRPKIESRRFGQLTASFL